MTSKDYHSSAEASTPLQASNTSLRITVTLRAASKPGSIKAHADIVIDTGSSKIEVFGLSIIKHDPEKRAWISYPQRPCKDSKKYFPIVRVTGVLHDKICAAVLAEWERTSAPARDRGGVPRPANPLPHTHFVQVLEHIEERSKRQNTIGTLSRERL